MTSTPSQPQSESHCKRSLASQLGVPLIRHVPPPASPKRGCSPMRPSEEPSPRRWASPLVS
eukprot:9202961-Alexandrium_andersonii.AAC.1